MNGGDFNKPLVRIMFIYLNLLTYTLTCDLSVCTGRRKNRQNFAYTCVSLNSVRFCVVPPRMMSRTDGFCAAEHLNFLTQSHGPSQVQSRRNRTFSLCPSFLFCHCPKKLNPQQNYL